MKSVFADLSAKYFTVERPGFFPAPASATAPWGAIMEIGYPEAVVTSVTFSDGTVSVLRSAGGGFFGGGDEAVQNAGRCFLRQAQLSQARMRLATDFPPPETGQVVFYLRTDSGVFTASASESDLQVKSHNLCQLH